jgi:hypothetical protein
MIMPCLKLPPGLDAMPERLWTMLDTFLISFSVISISVDVVRSMDLSRNLLQVPKLGKL